MQYRDLLAMFRPIDHADALSAYLRMLAEKAEDRIDQVRVASETAERIGREFAKLWTTE